MRPSFQLIAAVALVGRAVAESSIVSAFLPFDDETPFVASVVSANKDATTMLYSCAPGVASDDCGLLNSATVVVGPSTWAYTLSESETTDLLLITATCKLEPSDATCDIQQSTSNHGVSTTKVIRTVASGYQSDIQPVTITAGLDKLSAAAAATATTPAATSSGSTSGASDSSSTSAAKGSKTPNAAPAITQHAVLAGVAAVVGALAM